MGDNKRLTEEVAKFKDMQAAVKTIQSFGNSGKGESEKPKAKAKSKPKGKTEIEEEEDEEPAPKAKAKAKAKGSRRQRLRPSPSRVRRRSGRRRKAQRMLLRSLAVPMKPEPSQWMTTAASTRGTKQRSASSSLFQMWETLRAFFNLSTT